MAFTTNTTVYTGQATFQLGFALGITSREHVTVRVNYAVDGAGDPQYTEDFSWVSNSEIIVNGLEIGDTVTISRTVPKEQLIASFESGADITRFNLDAQNKQSIMAVQEILDGRFNTDFNAVENAERAEAAADVVTASEDAISSVLYDASINSRADLLTVEGDGPFTLLDGSTWASDGSLGHLPEEGDNLRSVVAADGKLWEISADPNPLPLGATYARPLSEILGRELTIDDFVPPSIVLNEFDPAEANADVTPYINDGLEYIMSRETGGKLLIPARRYFCDSSVQLLRGTNIQSMELAGMSEHSILDFRRSVNANCLEYLDPTGDGPTYIKLTDFTIRGDNALTMRGVNADFLSTSRFSGMVFEKLATAVQTRESFSFDLFGCRFNTIKNNVFLTNSNAHAFRMINCRGFEIARNDEVGAVVNFNTDENQAETHTVLISGCNFDKIGSLIRTSGTSGGLTGLTMLGVYTEGFHPGKQLFDFSADGVRSFVWRGGSVSKADIVETPDIQYIDNVTGGSISGIRNNGLDLRQGTNTQYFDWGVGSNTIGGGATDDGWTAATYEAPWVTQPGRSAVQYTSDENGVVHLRGAADYGGAVPAWAGGSSNVVFTLPPGLRPENTVSFTTVTTNGASVFDAKIAILISGEVVVAETENRRVNFDGISFKGDITL